jgi:serine/threonine protein kinase
MSAMLLGNYRLIEKIGQGGMGEVWKAEDTRLGRTVAIKILPQAVAADAQAIARMKREARTAAQIYHPNIATIHAFEEAGDRIFIVMEYVEGEPLTQLIRRGPIAEADVCRIGRSVADALAEAHEKGIIHRDIKPDNIMVKGARVKVLDFGIAKQVEQQGVDANDPTTVLTQQGMIIGTVFYMSPEQALGKPLDARTDLFSLGVVLYEAVTGRRPFHGDSATDTITRIVRDEAPLPQNVSRGLATIIHRCLRKNREDRFPGAHELSQALEAQLSVAPTAPLTQPPAPLPAATTVLTTAPQVKPRSSPWMWIALIALFVIVTMVLSQRTREKKEPVVSATTATTATTGSSVPRALGSSGAEQTVTAAPVIEEPATTTTMPPKTTTQPPPEEPRTRATEEPVSAQPAPLTTTVQPTPASADADYNAGVT